MNANTRLRFAGGLLATAVGGIFVLGAGPSLASPQGWKTPACETVAGDGAFSFTTDGGATITPTSTELAPIAYSTVAPLRRPGHLGLLHELVTVLVRPLGSRPAS